MNALLEFGAGGNYEGDEQSEKWKENYHLAFRALTCPDTLRIGMKQAMRLQQV